jgi:hypothetical protein
VKMDDNLHQRVLHLEQLIVSRVSSHQSSSVQFATVLVANLMIINSGALFAIASMMDSVKGDAALGSAYWSAASFVLGIILATLCGFSAYHNFMALAQFEALQGQEGVFDEKYPDTKPGLTAVDSWKTEIQSNQNFYEKVINFSLWSGNIAGILSLVSFVVGCYFVGQSVFT